MIHKILIDDFVKTNSRLVGVTVWWFFITFVLHISHDPLFDPSQFLPPFCGLKNNIVARSYHAIVPWLIAEDVLEQIELLQIKPGQDKTRTINKRLSRWVLSSKWD